MVFFQQQRGDVNADCKVTSADIIYMVNYVFKTGPDPMPIIDVANVNCEGAVTAADIVFIVNYVFKGGDAPLGICPP
jgi:hypothetical protein